LEILDLKPCVVTVVFPDWYCYS